MKKREKSGSPSPPTSSSSCSRHRTSFDCFQDVSHSNEERDQAFNRFLTDPNDHFPGRSPALFIRAQAELQRSNFSTDPADVAQETTLRLFQGAHRIRKSLRSWIIGTIRKIYLKEHERSATRAKREGSWQKERKAAHRPDDEKEELAYRNELKNELKNERLVRDAISKLKPAMSHVVKRRIYDLATFKAIGEELDISEGAARLMYHRAKDKLRELLAPHYA